MNQRIFPKLIAAAAIALFCLSAAPARADVIDGDWCNADGKQMTIRGPRSSPRAANKRAANTPATALSM